VTAATKAERRPDPRPARTRAALIEAAQQILATSDRGDASIQEITEIAGVAQGSFYNHFESKDELFDTAVVVSMEAHADLLESVTADLTDPLEVYVVGIRQTGRLAAALPLLRTLVVRTGLRLVTADFGLTPRAIRDLAAAREAGRVRIDDLERTQAVIGGMLLGLFAYIEAHPDVDAAAATDDLAMSVLSVLGLDSTEANALVSRPLPHGVNIDEIVKKSKTSPSRRRHDSQPHGRSPSRPA
jgi:AcrR family transcriptional regulator